MNVSSLRDLVERLGLSGEISLVKDILGYTSTPDWELSLRSHLNYVLKPYHIDLNIHKVIGNEAEELKENFVNPKIDAVIRIAREILAVRVGLAINRIHHQEWITNSNFEFINSNDEAKDLTRSFSGDREGAIDCFFVLGWPGKTLGLSPVPGPEITGMKGLVVELGWNPVQGTGTLSDEVIGQVLAHEIGHFLGVDHVCELESSNEYRCGRIIVRVPCGEHLTERQYLMHPIIPNGNLVSDPDKQIMLQHRFVDHVR